MRSFLPWDGLSGLKSSCLPLLLVCGSFYPQFCLPEVKRSTRLRSGDLAIEEYSISLPLETLVFSVFFGSLTIGPVRHCPNSFTAFSWIWAGRIDLYITEFILLLLSAVTSSINTTNPVPLTAVHVHVHNTASTMSNRWCGGFGSWAVHFLHHPCINIFRSYSPISCCLVFVTLSHCKTC